MVASAITLSEEQQQALETLKTNRLCLLTGGPGVGKTTVLADMARSLNLATTSFCAPTGRAAQRMTEALNEAGLYTRAHTIHSLLVPMRNGHDKKGWGFNYNRSNRHESKTFIVDEMSMVDNQLMRSLLEAMADDARLVMIGDPDQLPPVGVGAALRDFIQSEIIPHAKLTKPHRFSGRIAHVCQSINLGKKWMPSPSLDDAPEAGPFGPENLRHLEYRDSQEITKAMRNVIEALVERRAYNPKTDIQVMCARNDQGGLSRKVLNSVLQDMLNPHGKTEEGVPYRVGDKVMCLQNGLRDAFDSDGEDRIGQTYITNGEQGIVVKISKKEALVRFCDTHVNFPRGTWESQLTLSYAITVHKAQGGGWPACIYVVDEARHIDRSLIYTAISRAKRLCFSIGRKHLLDVQCQRVSMERRKTFLSEGIRDYMELSEI